MEKESIIQGFKSGGSSTQQSSTRTPVEAPEGINTVEYPRTATLPGAISLTQVETLDLISEGEIYGLNEGEYVYDGTIGATGYNSVIYTPYAYAPGTSQRYLRSIYWNEVPVVNSENKFNFSNVQVGYSVGGPNGSITNRLKTDLTVSRPISERLRYGEDFSKIYRILNKTCKAVDVNIKVGSFSNSSTDPATYGDTQQTYINYNLYWKPLYSTPGKTQSYFSKWKSDQIVGKVNYGYIKTTRIDLAATTDSFVYESDFLGWEIKITRHTEDSTNSSLRNQSFVDSLTEIYGDVLSYPNSAIVACKFSAEFFSQIPSRAFDAKLLKVKVPNNYDPITKKYGAYPAYDEDGTPYTTDANWNGDWARNSDGTINKQWTDNPAWCFYDLISNRRYGLGQYISEDTLDKWTLYGIAQYCDVMVADGFGGVEPRFTCNLVIASRQEAYQVINDMASIFRAMVYYSAGTIYAVQDNWKDCFAQFTNANVEDGNFSYQSSSKRVRHSIAVVRYNDKTDFYKPAIEYVEDMDAIRKYGVREVEVTAFGCTSRGQANRLGKWILLSESINTETISFTAGLDAMALRPGDVFKVYDANRKGSRYAGRTYINNSASSLVLDSSLTNLSNAGTYTFSLFTPTFNYDTSQVTLNSSADAANIRRPQIQKRNFLGSDVSIYSGDDGNIHSQINFSSPFDSTNYSLSEQMIWMIEASGDALDPLYNVFEYYQTIKIEEKDETKYTISALSYNAQKYDAIENELRFEDPASQLNPSGPINLILNKYAATTNTQYIQYQFTPATLSGITSFSVYGKNAPFSDPADFSGSQYLINTLPRFTSTGQYFPANDGTYYFRVYSNNRAGKRSLGYAANNIDITNVHPIRDAIISSLRVDGDSVLTDPGIRNTGQYTVESPTFNWQVGFAQNLSVPIDYSYRITIREPANSYTPSPNIYFEVTGYKPSVSSTRYKFTLENNVLLARDNYPNFPITTPGTTGPYRAYDVVVEAMDTGYNTSAGGNIFNGTTRKDADYSNPYGYDILYANNPRFDAFHFSDGTTDANYLYKTDQWISTDGDIKIAVSGTLDTDIAGGFLYYSPNPFTINEVNAGTVGRKEFFNVTNSPVIISANVTGYDRAYIAVRMYDVFDQKLSLTGSAIESLLNLSNIVAINKRGAPVKNPALSFSKWIEITLDWQNSTVSDWWNTSYGISEVRVISYESSLGPAFYHEIYFSEPLASTNYVVYGNFTAGQPQEKWTNHITLTAQAGKIFCGILWNGKSPT